MIEIVNTSTMPLVYKTKNIPVIALTHGLQREHVAEIMRIAHLHWGDEIFAMLEGKSARRHNPRFYCFVDKHNPPLACHPTKALAIEEAQRLCQKTGFNVRVFQQVAVVETTVPKPEITTTEY